MLVKILAGLFLIGGSTTVTYGLFNKISEDGYTSPFMDIMAVAFHLGLFMLSIAMGVYMIYEGLSELF